jgi:hypothetical protein
MAWTFTLCPDYEKRKKDFTKSWPHEMQAIATNLNRVLQSLENGARPEQLTLLGGFVHGGYPLGIISVDQTGHEKPSKPKALRLYLYPDATEQTLYVLLLGDKQRQSDDVKLCKEFVARKIASRGTEKPELG